MTSGIATSSRAEVRVEGTVAELRITTTDKDAIADVLAALKATFNIDYRAAIRLDATARSTYSGSLRQVIANVLDGYSYVIRKQHDAVEVIVIGRKGEHPASVQSSPAPSRKGIVSQWR